MLLTILNILWKYVQHYWRINYEHTCTSSLFKVYVCFMNLCQLSSMLSNILFQDDGYERKRISGSWHGPQTIIARPSKYMIVFKNPTVIFEGHSNSAADLLSTTICVYFLLDLTYPCAFGQMLGLLSEEILRMPFPQKTKPFILLSNLFKASY